MNTMTTRRIGALEASTVGLGCNNFGRRLDGAAAGEVVDAALAAGINFFDTANTYGDGLSEEYLGRALGRRRDDVLVASKFGMRMPDGTEGARPEYARRCLEDSLRRLGTDWLDLYQLHKPDPDVPIAETLGALNEMVEEGLVREIGCSNFSVAQLEEAEEAAAGGARFVSVQNHYSLLHREPEEDGVLGWCLDNDVAFIPFFPLQNGLLTGKYRAGREQPEGTRLSGTRRGSELLTEENLALIEDLVEWTEGRGRGLIELAFGWLLRQRAVASVIAGATTPAQIAANAAAASWEPSADEAAEVREILRRHGA